MGWYRAMNQVKLLTIHHNIHNNIDFFKSKPVGAPSGRIIYYKIKNKSFEIKNLSHEKKKIWKVVQKRF
jgi:hypothetical protein